LEVQHRLNGPTVDFVLGRIYEEAVHKVHNFVPPDTVRDDKTFKAFIREHVSEKNCRLLM
jgi:hypothetical protein